MRAVADRLGLLPPAGRARSSSAAPTARARRRRSWPRWRRPHGERVGLFTSPHLLRYHERIRVDGRRGPTTRSCARPSSASRRRAAPIADLLRVQHARGAAGVPRRRRSSATVLEVGLGGRLDATNIVDADVAVLCSVGLDHRDWLGDTLEEIGAEKAGIFRAGRPRCSAARRCPRRSRAALAALGVRATRGRRGTSAGGSTTTAAGTIARPASNCAALPPPVLAGSIQYRNAAVALRACTALHAPRVPVAAAVAAALRAVRLAGPAADSCRARSSGCSTSRTTRPRPRCWPRNCGRDRCVGAPSLCSACSPTRTWLRSPPRSTPLVDHWLLCTLEGERALAAEQLRARMGRLRGSVELRGRRRHGLRARRATGAARRSRAGVRLLPHGGAGAAGASAILSCSNERTERVAGSPQGTTDRRRHPGRDGRVAGAGTVPRTAACQTRVPPPAPPAGAPMRSVTIDLRDGRSAAAPMRRTRLAGATASAPATAGAAAPSAPVAAPRRSPPRPRPPRQRAAAPPAAMPGATTGSARG